MRLEKEHTEHMRVNRAKEAKSKLRVAESKSAHALRNAQIEYDHEVRTLALKLNTL